MSRAQKKFSVAKISFSLMLVLIMSAAVPAAFAQEDTSNDSVIPLVYNVLNTGAGYAAPVFPSFGQLPIIRPLPDPFIFANGSRDTSFSNWERRRNEIKAAIEKYEIGPVPDCSDCTITATYTPPASGSVQGLLTTIVTRNGKSLTLNSKVNLPQGMGSGPFPALIPMVFFSFGTGPNYGSLPSSVFSTRAVATVQFVHNNVTTYGGPKATDPFYQLYPELCAGSSCAGSSNSGQYAAWSWGVSRVIDGIIIATKQATNPLPIDVNHLAVTGCSYAGKMALFAGAFDERIALTVAQENGGGGAPSWRISQEIEADHVVESLTHTDHNWFAGQMFQFSDNNVYKLPTDHHELMAMVAPRALLETGNTNYNWLSNRSNYISARATQRIYNTFGIGDRFGFYIDGGHAHCGTLAAEAPAIAAFVDKFMLGSASVDSDVEVNPFPTLDFGRWTAWWGTGNPKFPDNWNPGDGTLVMSMNRPQDIQAGDTVLAGYSLYMPNGHPAATVSLAGGSVQTDITCVDGNSYTLTIPMPAQSYSIPANDDSWLPSPNQKAPAVYQGAAQADAACIGGTANGAFFSAVGVNDGKAGDPGGPGFTTTDTTDPLNVRFHSNTSDNGAGGSWSPTVTVNYNH